MALRGVLGVVAGNHMWVYLCISVCEVSEEVRCNGEHVCVCDSDSCLLVYQQLRV